MPRIPMCCLHFQYFESQPIILLKDKINIYIPTRDLRPQLRPHREVLTSKCSQLNNSSLVYMLDFWNILPEYIRLAQTIDSFKHNIYQYLLLQDSNHSLSSNISSKLTRNHLILPLITSYLFLSFTLFIHMLSVIKCKLF